MKSRKKTTPAAMKSRKKSSRPGSLSGGGDGEDPFFESDPKRRRRGSRFDEEIESDDDDDVAAYGSGGGDDEEEGEEEEEEETVAEKRKRLANQFLEKISEMAKRREEDEEEDEEEGEERVAKLLQKKQLEESGRKRRELASRVLLPESRDGFRLIVKHRQPVTAVALSMDEKMGFSASKDGSILHWDVETGKSEKYFWPNEDALVSHHAKSPLSKNRSKNVLALAVSSDGRYLASGGADRHIHLWDVRSREHIQAFSGHKAAVSCLAFGRGSSELFSGSFDRNIMQWNAEDRTYMHCLHGHQNEILTIDSLNRERVLTVGRDRTMRLWKIPEETQLVFRAPAASLECCCFINGSEFLSGSDDGSLELWSILRKKPTHIVKNAHALLPLNHHSNETDNEKIPKENGTCKPENFSSAHSWVSSVAVCTGSDLAASGAANGVVRLWAIEPDSRGMRPLFNYSLDGFVNSLAFAKSGRFLLAGVGQEPRLGRWGRVRTARNGVAIHMIRLTEEKTKDL